MKKNLSILALLFAVITQGQPFQYSEVIDTVILAERNVYLNSITRASLLEGASRNTIGITIPENTIEWYYAFSTTEGEKGEGFLDLATNLYATALTDGAVGSSLSIPQGVDAVDVYLISGFNANVFASGQPVSIYDASSVSNSTDGAFKVTNPLEGRYAIALSNPSQLNGVHVFVEVLAVTSEKTLLDQDKIEEARIYTKFALKKFQYREYNDAQTAVDNSLKVYQLGLAYGIQSAIQVYKGDEMAALNSLKEALLLLDGQSTSNEELNSLRALFKQLKKKEKIKSAQQYIDLINDQRWENILAD